MHDTYTPPLSTPEIQYSIQFRLQSVTVHKITSIRFQLLRRHIVNRIFALKTNSSTPAFQASTHVPWMFDRSMASTWLPWSSCVNGGGGTVSGTIHNILNFCKWPFTTGKTLTTPMSNPRTLFIIVLVYLTTLSVISTYMRLRRNALFGHSPFFIRIAAAHNVFLSLLSLWMNLHVTRTILVTVDLKHTICIPRGQQFPLEMQMTLYIFLISKIYELLDTPILVVRRRPLSFLHVWHHSTVIFEIWGWIDQKVALGLYGMWFNTAIHVVMYAYYAIVLHGYKVRAKVLITVTQIFQFVTGFLSLLPFLVLHATSPKGCEGSVGLILSSFINGSYLILFLMFYRKTYATTKGQSEARLQSRIQVTISTLTPPHTKTFKLSQKMAATTVTRRSTGSSIKQPNLSTSTPSGSTTAISTSSNLESHYQRKPSAISVPTVLNLPLQRQTVDTPRPDTSVPSARSSRASLTPEGSTRSLDAPWLGEILTSSKTE